MKSVSPDIYTEDYFLRRCGGVEFFDLYKADILKPMMQLAINRAELKPGMKILDVGCGRGELVAHLARQGHDILGIDYSKSAIDLAKKNFPDANFIHGDLLQAKLEPGSFDRIFFLGTIEHLYDGEIQDILTQFQRLLKPEGWVIVSTCTNSLYYKVWSYRFRQGLGRVLNKIGIRVKIPCPPRSEEDLAMHINEQNYFSLQKHFSKKFQTIEVEPRANPKMCVREIYGDHVPANFPLKSSSGLKCQVSKALMSIPFFNFFLTRANIALLKASVVLIHVHHLAKY